MNEGLYGNAKLEPVLLTRLRWTHIFSVDALGVVSADSLFKVLNTSEYQSSPPAAKFQMGTPGLVLINGDHYRFSADGVVWQPHSGPAMSNPCDIAFGAGRYLVVQKAFNGPNANFSTDGLTWADQALPESQKYDSIAWNGTRFVATYLQGTNPGTSNVMTSLNGVTWAKTSIPGCSTWNNQVKASGTTFTMEGNATGTGTHCTSTDGINWTDTTPAAPVIPPAIWRGNRFPGPVDSQTLGQYTVSLELQGLSLDGGLHWVKELPPETVQDPGFSLEYPPEVVVGTGFGKLFIATRTAIYGHDDEAVEQVFFLR